MKVCGVKLLEMHQITVNLKSQQLGNLQEDGNMICVYATSNFTCRKTDLQRGQWINSTYPVTISTLRRLRAVTNAYDHRTNCSYLINPPLCATVKNSGAQLTS